MIASGRDKIETPEQVLIEALPRDSHITYISIYIHELLRFRLMRRLEKLHFSLSKLKKLH